jgi:ATP/maltotriose-dependent transcriptional regulator MalT
MVHRSQLLQLHGAWADALVEARRAGEQLAGPPARAAAGAAFYQQAELHRLRGEFGPAEEAYLRASRWLPEPQPGLALLRLMQGQTAVAAAAIRRVLADRADRVGRTGLLPAQVEIMLAAGDGPAARAAAAELSAIAADVDTPWLQALAAQANGAVLLDQGEGAAALAVLRRACRSWQELDAPYDAARVRVLLGLACAAVGDGQCAALEFDAARWVFRQLGAAPDLARVEALSDQAQPTDGPAGGLTERETQVLRLVATGKTNRAIAADLFLSEKTVARHLSNIFAKLGLSSRSAATAYAYEHGVIEHAS